ncbi:MAG: hypothetical protein LUH21_04485 [Clostridiales bacterium]|nr:hypothetical protein [Clostridiales bacterium]
MTYDEYESNLLNKRVRVINTGYKKSYKKLLNLYGVVERGSSNSTVGVRIDGVTNKSSSYGVFWLKSNEIEIMEEEKMEGFKNVAIVNLLDDYNKKDYGFALYDTEYDLLSGDEKELVVVNARGKDNRTLGKIKEIVALESYGKGVTAQVVGVVNMNGYNARIAEEKRQEEIKKKKDKLKKEFKERLRKLEDDEYYAKMAERYADRDPELVKLVEQLKELGE